MARVELNEEGQKLRDEVAVIFAELQRQVREHVPPSEATARMYDEVAQKANQLHMIVRPKHHKYMLKNRGCPPEQVEFYRNYHAVQDLLAYIEDTSANDDPEDVTVGDRFDFRIYTRRFKGYDNYHVQRTATGWHVEHLSYAGDCDTEGKPVLFAVLDHDSVSYPHNLDYQMYDLWRAANEMGLTHDQVQQKLNAIAEWVSTCERSRPATHY